MFPCVLQEWLIMRRSLRYGTLIFREFRRTHEGIARWFKILGRLEKKRKEEIKTNE